MIRPLLAAGLLIAALLGAGCGRSIGDNCSVNVDCSALGDRFCDISAPNGYCTMEGCDYASCPSEAVCIRFFTPLPDKSCTDSTQCAAYQTCQSGRCTGACSKHEDCGTGQRCVDGKCASESSERRWCQKKCDDNDDCRTDEGYECRATGTGGAEPYPEPNTGVASPVKFCVQRGH